MNTQYLQLDVNFLLGILKDNNTGVNIASGNVPADVQYLPGSLTVVSINPPVIQCGLTSESGFSTTGFITPVVKTPNIIPEVVTPTPFINNLPTTTPAIENSQRI